MASLKIKTGTPVEVKKGLVELNGQVAAIYEIGSKGEERLVFGYCLQPGETIRRKEGDDYIVDF